MLIYYCRKEDHDAVRLTILFPMHCGHVLPECGPVVGRLVMTLKEWFCDSV